jgi:Cdc6-like AAA superfamily ATPase
MATEGQGADWDALASEVYAAFSPGSPIKLQEDLAGREEQATRLRNIVLGSGEHALIYGERGVGKTSIANTFHLSLNSSTRHVYTVPINCGSGDFDAIWRKVFKRIRINDGENFRNLDELYKSKITPDDVEVELLGFGINDLPIIILDEFDQIKDDATKQQMTETIKSLSDHAVHTKIVLVGIAKNTSELIAHHASISRSLKQVQMPRLALAELEWIVTSRYKKCGLKVSDDAVFQIAFLARGLPYYAHLIGRHAAMTAINGKSKKVEENDVFDGLKEAIKDMDQTITESYLKAIVSQKPDETLYEPVLVACALAESDDLGQFQQAAVGTPLADIAPRTPPYSATTFAFHMNEFCEEKRGCILNRTGEVRNYRYAFSDAMMQPYVIIRALESERLSRVTFEKFISRRQMTFGSI